MPYTPKTDWAINDVVTPTDMNRIESGLSDAFGKLPTGVHVGDYGAVGDGQIIVDALMTAGSAVLTSAAGLFTAADVNKKIIVSGVGPSSDSLVTTIQSYQSATQVTLNAAASTSSPDPVNTRLAVWGTDDTAAIQAASDAAAADPNGFVFFQRKVYLVAGALQQGGARKANSQITLPNASGQMTRLTWTGLGGGSTPLMPFPSVKGTVLVSLATGASYSATYGIPSVIGGPTQEQNSVAFSKCTFNNQGITVLTPRNPSLTALNLECMGAASVKRASIGTLEWGYQATGLEHLAISEPTHPAAAGIIWPRVQNLQGGSGAYDETSTWGYYCGIVPSEHIGAGSTNRIFCCKIPIGVRGGTGVVVTGQPHMSDLGVISTEANTYGISGWDPSSATNAGGVIGVPSAGFFKVTMDIEDYTDNVTGGAGWAVLGNHINDPSNNLRGEVTYSRYTYTGGTFGGPSTLVTNGGLNVFVRNLNKNFANGTPYLMDNILPWSVQVLPIVVGAVPAATQGATYSLSGGWNIAALAATGPIHPGEWVNNGGTPAIGDELAWDVVLAAGTWEVNVVYLKFATAAIFKLRWENNDVLTGIDSYNASTTYNSVATVSLGVLSTAKHRLSLAVTGRNAANTTNYLLGIQGIHLRRTA